MTVEIIPISEVKKNLSAVVDKVEKEKKAYRINRNSRAVAMIININEYNTLLHRLEDLEDIRDMLEAQKEPGRPFAAISPQKVEIARNPARALWGSLKSKKSADQLKMEAYKEMGDMINAKVSG